MHNDTLGAMAPAFLLAALLGSAAGAMPVDPGDVFLAVADGALITGHIDEDESVTLPVAVFGGTFGDGGFPGFTAEPGFDAFPATFAVGTTIGFNITEPLQVWNGTGFVPTGGETLQVSFLSLSATTGAGFVAGFELAVQPNGGFHRHYTMLLLGPGGAAPADGVYLLVREFSSSDPAIPGPATVYFVLGHNVPEAAVDAAATWLEGQLSATCPGDFDDDGDVGGADLGLLLSAWGTANPTADLDANGTVDGADLGALLASWGRCPGPASG